MINDQDHYEQYYADKLWNLLPAVYRALDTGQFNVNGPLRELVNRIGAQAAVLRRGIDRMWEDQSIETCDDWLIPYIGDLLATNLVANLDTRSQRLDVAKTIHYRRGKGTLNILEEIAQDVTGWNVEVVEFFRRLGRTRHELDPAIGLANGPNDDVAQFQIAQGLIGSCTRTGIGGLADLRNVRGAARAYTAFDEYFHTADFRRGQGQVGWYGIPQLGVFLWRLASFAAGPTTPVPITGCPGWFTFDPTGRDIPLFAAAATPSSSSDETQGGAVESQFPTPISQPLWNAQSLAPAGPWASVPTSAQISTPPPPLYPNSLAVLTTPTPQSNAEALSLAQLAVRPPQGRFHVNLPVSTPVWVTYHYGFSAQIGAGPYDRRRPGTGAALPVAPPTLEGGGQIGIIAGSGIWTILDSLTYLAADRVTVAGSLTIRADNQQRPLIRFAPTPGGWTEWTMTGSAVSAGGSGNCLVLNGLFLSGADIVLAGEFDRVVITCCTLDPGSTASPPSPLDDRPRALASIFSSAADLRDLVPCRLWIEGQVNTLTVDRCITGPIRTRASGQVETLTVTDSIIQAIPTTGLGPIAASDVKDPSGLENQLHAPDDPVASHLRSLSPALARLEAGAGSASVPYSGPLLSALLGAINALLDGPSIYDPSAFQAVLLSPATQQLLMNAPAGFSARTADLNRLLLEDAFPSDLADAALALGDGEVVLSRSTVLGRVVVHSLQASECIMSGLAQVDDLQDGCVRYSAWTAGSLLPRQYEGATIAPGVPLFTSTDFGQPGYCQLLATVDTAILSGALVTTQAKPTIAAGAENGSEMGAFASQLNPIKAGGLLLKYQEYLPAGLTPVLIYVT